MIPHPKSLHAQNAHVFLSTAADFIEIHGHTPAVMYRSEKRLSIKYALIRSHDVFDQWHWRLLMNNMDNTLERLLMDCDLSNKSKHRIWTTYKMLEMMLSEDPDKWAKGKSTEEIVEFLRDAADDISYA